MAITIFFLPSPLPPSIIPNLNIKFFSIAKLQAISISTFAGLFSAPISHLLISISSSPSLQSPIHKFLTPHSFLLPYLTDLPQHPSMKFPPHRLTGSISSQILEPSSVFYNEVALEADEGGNDLVLGGGRIQSAKAEGDDLNRFRLECEIFSDYSRNLREAFRNPQPEQITAPLSDAGLESRDYIPSISRSSEGNQELFPSITIWLINPVIKAQLEALMKYQESVGEFDLALITLPPLPLLIIEKIILPFGEGSCHLLQWAPYDNDGDDFWHDFIFNIPPIDHYLPYGESPQLYVFIDISFSEGSVSNSDYALVSRSQVHISTLRAAFIFPIGDEDKPYDPGIYQHQNQINCRDNFRLRRHGYDNPTIGQKTILSFSSSVIDLYPWKACLIRYLRFIILVDPSRCILLGEDKAYKSRASIYIIDILKGGTISAPDTPLPVIFRQANGYPIRVDLRSRIRFGSDNIILLCILWCEDISHKSLASLSMTDNLRVSSNSVVFLTLFRVHYSWLSGVVSPSSMPSSVIMLVVLENND